METETLKSSPSPKVLGSLRVLKSRRDRLLFSDSLRIDVVVAKWNQFENALRVFFPRKRAEGWGELAMLMVMLGAINGQCFPSYAYLEERMKTRAAMNGREDHTSKRSFWNMISFLEEEGLLVRHGARYKGGRQTSNDYDLRKLMKWLLKHAQGWLQRRRRGGPVTNELREEIDGVVWVKRGGAWIREMDLPPIGSPSGVPLPPPTQPPTMTAAAWLAANA